MSSTNVRLLEGVHCTIEVRRPATRVVLVKFSGTDTGELGDAPFLELRGDLEDSAPFALFIDAGEVRGVSIDVSSEWAAWLFKHKRRLVAVHMLTQSAFTRVSADFVRRFAELGDAMRFHPDRADFEKALAEAIEQAT